MEHKKLSHPICFDILANKDKMCLFIKSINDSPNTNVTGFKVRVYLKKPKRALHLAFWVFPFSKKVAHIKVISLITTHNFLSLEVADFLSKPEILIFSL